MSATSVFVVFLCMLSMFYCIRFSDGLCSLVYLIKCTIASHICRGLHGRTRARGMVRTMRSGAGRGGGKEHDGDAPNGGSPTLAAVVRSTLLRRCRDVRQDLYCCNSHETVPDMGKRCASYTNIPAIMSEHTFPHKKCSCVEAPTGEYRPRRQWLPLRVVRAPPPMSGTVAASSRSSMLITGIGHDWGRKERGRRMILRAFLSPVSVFNFVTPYPACRHCDTPRSPYTNTQTSRLQLLQLAARRDLLEPHILRSLSNVKVVSIHASCCGCYCVVLDIDGAAWIFGRNDKSCLGVSGVDAISENAPRRVVPQELGAPKSTRFVHAALGRNHTLLVGSEGQVWTAGANHAGQVRVLFVKQEGGSQHFCSHPVAVTAFWLPSV